jgi:FixJ family two-component response regulator
MTESSDAAPKTLATVFIVDDDVSIGEGLCNLLESVGIPTQHFISAESFVESWNRDQAGCLVLDVRLPGMTGVEFQEQMLQSDIRLPIIFMTAHADIAMVRKVMKAGAVEFLTKPFQQEELLLAIQHAFAIDRVHRREDEVRSLIYRRFGTLTEREREVMSMVTAGLLNKQIAAELKLSEITVKLHRRRVMEKMHADSLADLVRMCERASVSSWQTP